MIQQALLAWMQNPVQREEHVEVAREQLGQTLGIAPNQVSVKASTSAELGFVGQGEGIAVWAVALLEGA